jgi:tRNA-Thr(GGU) m(6)t(6)A37 methyltransferase TsaA
MVTMNPIGYFSSLYTEKHGVPRQANLVENEGIITLNKHCQFEQALEGLEQFERIWLVFLFHQHKTWKPKVLPPRGGQKRGVFATRSPHRPNFIGLSCVKLKAIDQLNLFILDHDLLDGTPILDLKPYLNYADSFISYRQGWLDELDCSSIFAIKWSAQAQEHVQYLEEKGCLIKTITINILQLNPFPYPNRRIRLIQDNQYELAYKTWRILYSVKENEIEILKLKSGYDEATLKGEKISAWNDVPLHQEFINYFSS